MAKKWPRRTHPSAPPFCYNLNHWEQASFRWFFLFSGSCRYNSQKSAKTGYWTQKLRKKLRKGLGFNQWAQPSSHQYTQGKLWMIRSFLDAAKGMAIILHTHHTLASNSWASQHTLHTVLPNSLACFPSVSRRFQRTTAYGPTYVPQTHSRPPISERFWSKTGASAYVTYVTYDSCQLLNQISRV